MFNRSTLIVLVVAIAAALGLWFGVRQFGPPGKPLPTMQIVKLLPQPRALPPVALKTASGSAITPAALKGRWTLMFLGYTHCPDVCPTTLAELAQAEKRWQSLPERIRPQVVFVSVDPERDSATDADRYAKGFFPANLGVTGDPAVLETLAKSLSMVFMKVPPPPGAAPDQYAVDHSASVAVLDPNADMAGVIVPSNDANGPSMDPVKIAADMIALTQATLKP